MKNAHNGVVEILDSNNNMKKKIIIREHDARVSRGKEKCSGNERKDNQLNFFR